MFSNSVSTITKAADIWGDDVLAKAIKEMMLHGPRKAMHRFNLLGMTEHEECINYLLVNKIKNNVEQ